MCCLAGALLFGDNESRVDGQQGCICIDRRVESQSDLLRSARSNCEVGGFDINALKQSEARIVSCLFWCVRHAPLLID